MPGVVSLTFNRPDKLNALSTPMVQQFESAIDAIAADASVRAVILQGAGGKAFVAGADIAEYRGNRTAAFNAYQFESRRVFDKLEALPQPVIAAIAGYALGGGFEIALCCDILICTASSLRASQKAWSSSVRVSRLSALSLSGRLTVTTRTAPRSSTSRLRKAMGKLRRGRRIGGF